MRQLADGRGLSGAVDADHEDYFGCAVDSLDGTRVGGIQDGQQFVFQQALEFVGVFDLLAVGFFSEFVEDFTRGGVAEVGADEGGFEVIQRGAVNFFAERNNFFDALAEIFAGACHRLFHAIEEAGLLLFVEAAKKGLNHRGWESR